MQHRPKTIFPLAAVAMFGFTLTSPSANAELIDILGGGGGVTASSEIPEPGTGDGKLKRNPGNLIDGSGLTGADHDQVTSNQWLSSSDGNAGWGGLDADLWVLFDLGAVYTVDSMEVWNFSEGSWSVGRGVNAVTVEYGDTTADLVLGVIDDSSTVPGITDLTIAPTTSPTITGTTYAMGGIKARYIKIDITPGSGIGNHGGDNNFYGMNEVQFDGSLSSEPFAITEISRDPATGELRMSWESADGKLYNLRSVVDPSTELPGDWPIFGGQADLAATPPENTLSIPLPPEAERFFVIEEFNAPPVTALSDDFESGLGGWTMGSDGAAGTVWELGTPSAVGPPAANSPANCFGTNLSAEYAINANIWLRSPEIDLTTAGGATLSYFQFADIEAGFDMGTVSVLDAFDDSVLVVLETPVDGADTDWGQVTKTLPAEALGKTIKIEFRFESDELESFAGWYLDDVEVTVP